MRATAVALSIFTIHILGDVPHRLSWGGIGRALVADAVLIIPVAVLMAG